MTQFLFVQTSQHKLLRYCMSVQTDDNNKVEVDTVLYVYSMFIIVCL